MVWAGSAIILSRSCRAEPKGIGIIQEAGVHHPDGFDQLEQLAIRTFGPKTGTPFTHPNAPPGRKLVFDNRRENAPPQNTLYLLVG